METIREHHMQHSLKFLHHDRITLGNLKGNSSLQKRLLLFLVLVLIFSGCRALAAVPLTETEQQVVKRFQSYLQINTAHPDPDYAAVNKFLIEQGKQIGLDVTVWEFTPMKPVVLFTWKGEDPSLPSILLYSHTDVVPAEDAKWDHNPFGAHMDEVGKIFGRGAQDMKCVGTQYLEAIRNLRAAGFKPRRSIHVAFAPDEEIGGEEGAKKFYESDEFRELNVAFVLDEGTPAIDDLYHVGYGEKSVWWFVVKASGSPAHGSRLFDGMAVQNLRETLDKIEEFRTREFEKLKSGVATGGEIVSVNNVFLKAGTSTPTGFVMNLQPSEAEAGFDMRVPPFADEEHLEKLIREEWAPSHRNLTVSFMEKQNVKDRFGKPCFTPTDDTNPWWARLKAGIANAGGKLAKPQILMGASDARFARLQGVPAFSFSPMTNTPYLLHDHNEFLHVKEYLKGITVYEEIIKSCVGSDEQTANSEAPKLYVDKKIEGVHTEL